MREAYKAVFNDDKTGKYKLARHRKIYDVKGIQSDLQKKIEKQRERCESLNKKGKESKKKVSRGGPACLTQLDNLKGELSRIKKFSQREKTNPEFGVYSHLVLISHHVRMEILKEPYLSWEKNCMEQSKVNTPNCRSGFFEIKVLQSIIQDLSQAAHLKALNKKSYDTKKMELNELIQRYEGTNTNEKKKK